MKKWASRRWWVCIWAILMTTFLMVYSIITKTDLSWFGAGIALFQLIIGGYIASDTMTKRRTNDGA